MKKLIAISLTLIILFQCSTKLAIVINYEVHKEYITANFCINKLKPQMHCNGKCHLSKQIKAQEATASSLSSILKNIEEATFCFSSFLFFEKRSSPEIAMITHRAYAHLWYSTPAMSIDQPPQ